LPLVYRDLGYSGNSHFSADFQVRTRQVIVNAAAKLQFDAKSVAVEQKLGYRILYEPQRTFTLVVPETLAARGEIKILLGNQSLLLVPAPATSSASGPALARYQISTPQEQRGNVDLVVQYSLPLPVITAEKPTEFSIPLVIPAEEEVQSINGQLLDVTGGESLNVELAPSSAASFQAVVTAGSAAGSRYSSARFLPSARWKLSEADRNQGRTVSVSRLWLQSLINEQGRQDRVAWKLRTAAQELAIQLPSGTEMESLEFALDGMRLADFRLERETAHLTLPPDSTPRERVLEAWYTMPAGKPLGDTLQSRLAAPRLQGVSQIREAYWQLCLPVDQHLLGDPAGFIPEMKFSWQNWFWDRRGSLSQEQLEEWSGASRQRAIPSQTNQYLFSSFGSVDNMTVFAVSRRVILVIAGALVLGLGLLLLHVRAVRHPTTALLVAVAVGATALTWPAIGLLFAQGAGLALAVVGFAILWQWGISGRPNGPAPEIGREKSSTRDRPSTTAAASLPQAAAPPASTATLPLVGAGESRT
jgi:hypothetical protein